MTAQIQLEKKDLAQYGESYKLTVTIEGRQYIIDVTENCYDKMRDEFPEMERSGQFGENLKYS